MHVLGQFLQISIINFLHNVTHGPFMYMIQGCFWTWSECACGGDVCVDMCVLGGGGGGE